MPWSVDHAPPLIHISVSNFSHFRHLLQNHLESLQLLSAVEQEVWWRGNLVEGIRAAWRFRNAKMVPFWYPRWPPWHPSWKSSNYICSKMKVWLSLNMMVGIGMLWKFRIAKMVLFQCPSWPPSWNSSNHISSQTVSQIEPKFDGRHWGDMEIQNC